MPKVKARKRVSIMKKVTILNVALCQGRHEIPQATDGYIFDEITDVKDLKAMRDTMLNFHLNNRVCQFNQCNDCLSCEEYWGCGGMNSAFYHMHLNIYVTGLTVALIEALTYCACHSISVTLYHFDRDTNDYFAQEVR